MTMLVPMMSAGIRSGVNWMRLKSSDDGVGQGPHQKGLAQPRHPFQERVPADKQAGQDAVDDLVVADDDLGDLGLDLVVAMRNSSAGLPSIRRSEAIADGPFVFACLEVRESIVAFRILGAD